MRLLFLSKRHPQQRDLIKRPYGRFYYLPTALAEIGHDVRVQLCSHDRSEAMESTYAGVDWSSHDVRVLGIRGLLRALSHEAACFRPDWIIGCSDSWLGWLAQRLARTTHAQLAIDAYDNFEAYMPWNLPLHWLWRRSVHDAALVTAAGPQLAQRLQSHRSDGHAVEVLPMAADPNFIPLDRAECRQQLGLPRDIPLAGYIGSWAQNRGTDMLLHAFRQARATRPDLHLVLSGHPPKYALNEPGVIGAGYVNDLQLPMLTNALDIACVITANTGFGRYSYPAKLCEAMACCVPVIATDTAPVRWMLNNQEEHLVPTDDAAAFAGRMIDFLEMPRFDYGPRPTWSMYAKRLDHLLMSMPRQKL